MPQTPVFDWGRPRHGKQEHTAEVAELEEPATGDVCRKGVAVAAKRDEQQEAEHAFVAELTERLQALLDAKCAQDEEEQHDCSCRDIGLFKARPAPPEAMCVSPQCAGPDPCELKFAAKHSGWHEPGSTFVQGSFDLVGGLSGLCLFSVVVGAAWWVATEVFRGRRTWTSMLIRKPWQPWLL